MESWCHLQIFSQKLIMFLTLTPYCAASENQMPFVTKILTKNYMFKSHLMISTLLFDMPQKQSLYSLE